MKIPGRLWSKWQDESGQNLALIALLMVVILGITAMALDGAYAFAQRRRMQNAADAAALAGARELALCEGGSCAQAVENIVTEYAETYNGADSSNLVIDGQTVLVEASKTFPTFFAGVIGIAQFTAMARSRAIYGAVAEMSEGVYPLAADWEDFAYGQTYDIYAGGGPGNFGWLGWDGCTNVPCLCESLTPPGNSEKYVNPHNPNDHVLSIGDWVEGSPGVANAACVRARLNALLADRTPITIVVWDEAEEQGANLNYRIAGFAQFILTDYRLPGQNRITGRFIRWVVPVTRIHEGSGYGLYGVKLRE